MVKNVTIKDVAREAGVSITTVSFILNGKANSVPMKTKERVYRVIEKLQYIPNTTARSLAMGRTNMIGVIVPPITNFFFAELVRFLQQKFAQYGYEILLSNNEEKAEKDLKTSNQELKNMVVEFKQIQEDFYEKLKKQLAKV